MKTITERAEKCLCSHGGEDFEDHTEGNGCERPGCGCKFWPQAGDEPPTVTFENTNTEVEYTQWYYVKGAPVFESVTQQGKRYQPVVVKWTFKHGEAMALLVTGLPIKKDGYPAAQSQSQMVPGIYIWNMNEWPDWLRHSYGVAVNDYRANRAAEAIDAVAEAARHIPV